MNDTDIIEALREKLSMPVGRHLYGLLGNYEPLERFAAKLRQAKTPEGDRFPKAISVNRGILKKIPDGEFRKLAENEAKRPEPTAAHVAKAFEGFLREKLKEKGLLVLANLEMLFAYHVDLSPLRTLSTDANRIILLLPGKREKGKIIMFPEYDRTGFFLPDNLIATGHIWEIAEQPGLF